MKKQLACMVLAALLGAISCAPNPPPSTPAATSAAPGATTAPVAAWEVEWNRTVAAAKKEGTLIIYGNTTSEMREAVSKAFGDKFGIPIEWLPGRANELVEKIISERRNGIYVPDVLSDATTSAMNLLKPTGAMEIMEPKLILPDVTDTSKWLNNRLWWVDPEHTHIAYFAIPQPGIFINTDMVKPAEMTSYNNLLEPRWKGKIVMDDPTLGGSGNSWVTAMAELIMDRDYLRKLAAQEPLLLRDNRQEAEWVARGKYPLGAGMSPDEMVQFIRAGAPVAAITPKEGTFVTLSRGGLSVLDRAPHPNAAKVYLNWALSKEGQTVISKSEGLLSARTDVSSEFVDPSVQRQPGGKYFDTITYEYQLKKGEYVAIAKDIFGSLVGR